MTSAASICDQVLSEQTQVTTSTTALQLPTENPVKATIFPAKAHSKAMRTAVMNFLAARIPLSYRKVTRVFEFEYDGIVYVCNIVEAVCAIMSSDKNADVKFQPIIHQLQDTCWLLYECIVSGVEAHGNVNEIMDDTLSNIFEKMCMAELSYLSA